MSWASSEMQGVNLGDQRLTNRLVKLFDTLGNNAALSIPSACGGWAETKAAYRFFDNPKVNAEKILLPHKKATIERIACHQTVLLIQDTTALNFSGQLQRTDIGPITREKYKGILLHPLIAVTPERLCLGVLDAYHWYRASLKGWKNKKEKNREGHNIAIEDKESYRWVKGYQTTKAIADVVPNTRFITVADREGDIYDLYHEYYSNSQPNPAFWLIRAKTNRCVLDDQHKKTKLKLIETVKASTPEAIIQYQLNNRQNEAPRLIKQAIYTKKLLLSPPDRKSQTRYYQPVQAQIVIATEIDPPENTSPIEWVLLTNVPLDEQTTAIDIVKFYLCRWEIEIYFRILKSGCNIEKLQLETASRFDACLTLYMIIAWRILYLTQLARSCPDIACTVVFELEEWHVAYTMTYQKKPPDKPISLAEMITLIAQFGGYLNRKNDIKPGPTALWIGLQKLHQFIKAKQIYESLQI